MVKVHWSAARDWKLQTFVIEKETMEGILVSVEGWEVKV